jgi:hypothetical protein
VSTVKLYRPIGIKELELIRAADWRKFPPRLFWQPIFYPVLNQHYAEQIALEWNTKDEFSGYCGIVTGFEVNEEHYSKFEVQNVGGTDHNELWVPAEELELFNQNIVGRINVLKVFFGDQFVLPKNETIAKELLKFKNNEVQ